jgi:hypothetical protein
VPPEVPLDRHHGVAARPSRRATSRRSGRCWPPHRPWTR